MTPARVPLMLAVLLGAAALCAGSVSALPGTGRLNVVVLMTDDQTVESMRVMPSVRRLLAGRGATFENSFVSFALCCPSRATFLTGQYAHNHGVRSNVPPGGGYEALDGASTLPVWLRRSGYATGLVGKYLNGYGLRRPTEIPPGWTEWYGSVDPSSYRYYGYVLNENGRLVEYGREPSAYKTDVYARLAADFVRRRARRDEPFFLWVSFLAPHAGGPSRPGSAPGSALPAPRHLGRFASERLPRPPSFNEADVTDKPGGIRVRPRLDPHRIAAATERYRRRLESLLAVDEAVARIVRELDRAGALDRTLILFTSDNGFLQGEHRIPIGKVALYEPSTRVPLVVRAPGVRPGLRLRQAVANVDLAPTILEAARARPGLPVDGQSLWPLLRDPGLFWGRDLLHEGAGTESSLLAFTALRTPRFVYASHFSGAEELYDMARDPDQLANLAADPAAAGIRSELRRRLAELEACWGSGCRRQPQITVAVTLEGTCPAQTAEIQLAGADVTAVDRVRYLVDGGPASAGGAAPAALVRPLSSASARIRAHVVLTDGRELTRDAVLPACR